MTVTSIVYDILRKFNPNHDAGGRFTSGGGGGGGGGGGLGREPTGEGQFGAGSNIKGTVSESDVTKNGQPNRATAAGRVKSLSKENGLSDAQATSAANKFALESDRSAPTVSRLQTGVTTTVQDAVQKAGGPKVKFRRSRTGEISRNQD